MLHRRDFRAENYRHGVWAWLPANSASHKEKNYTCHAGELSATFLLQSADRFCRTTTIF